MARSVTGIHECGSNETVRVAPCPRSGFGSECKYRRDVEEGDYQNSETSTGLNI